MKKYCTIKKTTMLASALMFVLSFLSAPAYAQPGSRGCNAHFNYRADSANALMVNFHTNMAHNASYAWDFGDGSTDTGATPQHTYAAAGSYNVCLTVTRVDSLGNSFCTNNYCTIVDVLSTPPACDAHFTADQNIHNGTVRFMSAHNAGVATYAWDFGDGSLDSGHVVHHDYAAGGTYYVCLSVTRTDSVGNVICTDNFCDSVYAAPQSAFGLNINPVCQARFRYESRFDDRDGRFFGGFYSGGQATYEWSFGDGGIDFVKNPIHTYPDTGAYYVCCSVYGTDSLGNILCASDFCDSVYIGVDHVPGPVGNDFGQQHHRAAAQVFKPVAGVFPNPVTGQSLIYIKNFSAATSFKVYNQSGQIVFEQSFTENGDYAFSKSSVAAGVYYYQVTDGQSLVHGKLVVE